MTTEKSTLTIERIETNKPDDSDDSYDPYGCGLGYTFIMNDGSKISFKMQHDQKCCENFGAYTDSSPLFDTFIGAVFESFKVGEKIRTSGSDERKLEVDVFTDRGKIKIVFYNEHNGYYSHDVSIHSKSINKIVRL